MEILSASSYFCNTSWLCEDSSMSTRWTAAENKAFENALAVFDENTPDRWHKVAVMVPGKTVGDVIRQYKELEYDVTSIEAGLIPVPGYNNTTTAHAYHYDAGFKQSYGRKSSSSSARPPSDQERKKGVPWTEEEHKLFLMGLKKYGKGDWRNISRSFVITRTPTQVASHAQKYFIRQLSGGKDKRRASIHDINLNDNQTTTTPLADDKKQLNSVALQTSIFTSSPYGINSYALQRDALHETSSYSYMGSQNVVFQMQPAAGLHYPNNPYPRKGP